MFLNNRTVSNELRTLRSLNARTTLSKKEFQYYLNLERGYKGECWLDKRLEVLPEQVLILRDLTYEVNHTTFQIDTLLIFQEKLYLLDVKNNDGDYYIEDGVWKTAHGTEIKNPQHQLTRCASLLRHLLQSTGFNLNITAKLVFVNPEFTLYQAPRTSEIVFPTQLNRFIDRLKTESCNLGHQHHRIAKQLLEKRVKENRHETKFDFQFNELKKGILCCDCYGFMSRYSNRNMICDKCKKKQSIDSALLRSIEEFRFLFLNEKLTKKRIYEFCDFTVSEDTIRKLLNKKFRLIYQGRTSYYIACNSHE